MSKGEDPLLTVMSFNVRNSRALEDQKDHNWVDRREKVVEIIRKYQPSVIGFQEVLHDQAAARADLVPHDDCRNAVIEFISSHTIRIGDVHEIDKLPSKSWPDLLKRVPVNVTLILPLP